MNEIVGSIFYFLINIIGATIRWIVGSIFRFIFNKNTHNFNNYFSGSKRFYNSEKTQFYNVILGIIFTIIFFATIT
tara:strand:+ start:256 stop:483 length:228 start_codon:yes stop_codon:yes gene_type:complete